MKIINNIKYLFIRIGRKIDRYVIVPITKFALIIKSNFLKDNKGFEKLLGKKNSLLIITLVLSIVLFIAVDSKTIKMIETSAEVLYGQPVIVQYDDESYALDGVPETVDITLIGRNSDLYLAKQIPSHEVTLNLLGLKPGVHKVALKYTRALDTINYKLDPSTVTVTIYPKVSEARTVNFDLINIDDLDSKLVIDKTEISRDKVFVKGSEATVKKVAAIKALIDINNFIDPKVGKLELQNIPLIAYDQTGNIINAEIVPSKISATVTISSPQKTVPINFVPTGKLSFGKAISSINASINEVTIYGNNETLATIESIELPIDVSGLKDDKEYNLTIKKPIGIRYISALMANVKVKLGTEITVEYPNINVGYQNLGSGFTVNAKGDKDRSITVIIKGVSSVINSLDASTIRAYVDLKGYAVGEHEVSVLIEKTDPRLTYIPKVKKVTLVIANKK